MSKVVNEYKMLKQNNKDCLYLFRLGRFYCFIGEDAEKINNYMVLKKLNLVMNMINVAFQQIELMLTKEYLKI